MKKALLTLTLAVAGTAMGQSGRLIFKGSSLGMPLSQFRAANSESVCTDTTPKFYGSEDPFKKPIPGDVICIASGAPTTVADKPVALIQYHFFSGKLWLIRLSIEPQYFGDVMIALVRQYQLDTLYLRDMIADSEDFQNNIGDAWGGVKASWKIGGTDQFISMREGPGNGPGKGGKFPLSVIVIQDTGTDSPKVDEEKANAF
jgi:hypothetical protein